MRKIIMTIMMVVCVNGMLAQTNEEINDSINEAPAGEAEVGEVTKSTNGSVSMVQLEQMFQKYAAAAQNENHRVNIVPITGKKRFSRRHLIEQRLEISIINSTDMSDENGEEVKKNYKNNDDVDDAQNTDKSGWGLNTAYSLTCVWGQIRGDSLVLNRLGMGYSTGFMACFDENKTYGTTCDFLFKIGFEAGNGHAMGIGVDLLLGSGKSAGQYTYTQETDEGNEPEDVEIPYTKWCLKYGFQFWVRSNLLQAQMKNTDVRIFARYVYSKNPDNTAALADDGIICDWHQESWSFGLTFCYTF